MAAAAYAAVVSVIHLIEQIQKYQIRQQIFLDTQLRQLESIRETVRFFQDFLEVYPHRGIKEEEDLLNQITDAAYAIEDTVDSYIVDDIHARYQTKKKKKKWKNLFRSKGKAKRRSNHFSQDLRKIMKDMNSIQREVVDIKENMRLKDHQHQNLASVASLEPPVIAKDIVVGLDDVLYQVVDKLTREQPSLQVIPITGMGGIGKTTLAKNAYDNRSIVNHFDICGWITVSQEYNECDMILHLLCDIKVHISESEKESKEYHQLGQKLHKHLWSRRYLIILDDMWDIEAWDKLSLFFPDNNNGSRVMITTRLSIVADNFGYSNLYEMKLLDENESWNLLRKNLFVQEDCPPELEEDGKKIAKNCKGLPLSIAVIGGLLAKSNMTSEYWEHVADDISTTINSEDNDRCLKILSLSYNCLPIHLKPCFLYMGIYPEDHEIRVSELIKLWVAEGFLKPHMEKNLEEIANDYLKDLIKRNLIFVNKFGSTGNMKYCKIHDLLRDLCLREAKKERFINVTNVQGPHTSFDKNILRRIPVHAVMKGSDTSFDKNIPRRIAVHAVMKGPDTSFDKNIRRRIAVHEVMPPDQIPQSRSFIRSLTCSFQVHLTETVNISLIRVLKLDGSLPTEFIQVPNSRYINCQVRRGNFPSASYLLWNLQTLIGEADPFEKDAPFNIWEMLQLRHLDIEDFSLTDPPCCRMDKINDIVLDNLQTLSTIENFKCSEEVLKRIPNIRKLKIIYPTCTRETDFSQYCLNNLGHLHKLQSLSCWICAFFDLPVHNFLQNLNFPDSLKKLTLQDCNIGGEGITTKIGLLPHLEKLKLRLCCIGEEWNPVEGQFLCLKYLEIFDNNDLVYWAADSTHFPCLEHLILSEVIKLKEIPFGIGEIETLRSIQVRYCSHSAVESANGILEYQQSLENEDFRLVVEEAEEDKFFF